jgi:hypothetical protein
LERLRRDPIKVAKQIEPSLRVRAVRKVRPSVLMDVTHRETVSKIAFADLRQDRLRGGCFDLRISAISPASVGFELVSEGQRPAPRIYSARRPGCVEPKRLKQAASI